MKQARIKLASIRPINEFAYTVMVELIVDEQTLSFSRTVSDLELIDQYKKGIPIPLIEYVTENEYQIKR
jgi:hypothetical protein